MLADAPLPGSAGTLEVIHRSAGYRYEILKFIAEELPRWRDRQDRPDETAEDALTSLLCAHLGSAARRSDGWDILQFRTEVRDEEQKSRKVDLAASPSACIILIEGQSYADFNFLFPIECKRLPTPHDQSRDEREYVTNRYSTTGGLQRFKSGHHGASHRFGAMIGYLQKGTADDWSRRIEGWIADLVNTCQPGWTEKDFLHFDRHRDDVGLAILRSSHTREGGLSDIEIHHLWIAMERPPE